MPADRLKSIESVCAFPKLYCVPVYKQFGSLPGLRLVLHQKVHSARYMPIVIEYIRTKFSHDPAPKHRRVAKQERF